MLPIPRKGLNKSNKKKKNIIIISPHVKIQLNQKPTEGNQARVLDVVKSFIDKYKCDSVVIIEPKDIYIQGLGGREKIIKRIPFEAFSFLKIKVVRLGSYFLNINPFYLSVLVKTLKKITPDIILIDSVEGTFSTYLIAKKIFRMETLVIQISHNVESEYIKFALKDVPLPKTLLSFFVLTRKVMEFLSLSYSDYVFAVSHENKKLFVEKYHIPPEKIRVFPPVVHIDVYSRSKRNQKRKNEIWAVFHGIYRTVQNREAFDVIIHRLAPKFVKYKNLKFVIFGKGLPKFNNGNVISLGFVDDVHEILGICDLAVVPLISGEGVKLKILDYMAVGLPIVTTKKGAEGLELVNGKHAIIVDDVNGEFKKAIEYLIENPKIRKKLGHNVRKLAVIKHAGGD